MARLLCEKSLYRFVRLAWPVIESAPFIDNWHIGFVCEHLQAVTTGQIPKLLINIPPGCSKSLLTSVLWPAWEWSIDPAIRWFFASYDQRLSTRDSVKCRSLLTSDWYRQMWPGKVQFRGDQDQKTYYETLATGWRLATSIGGHGTGEHPDRICLPPGSLIECDNGKVPIEKIRLGQFVLSCDHPYNRLGWSPASRLYRNRADFLIEVETNNGPLRLTPNHPVFVIGRGYIPAADIRPLDRLIYAGPVHLRDMQEPISGYSQEGGNGSQSILLKGVPAQGHDWDEPSRMARPASEVHCLPKGNQGGVGGKKEDGEVLLSGMQKVDYSEAWGPPDRAEFRDSLPHKNPTDVERWREVRHLWQRGQFGLPPYQRELERQSQREPMFGLPILPRQTSCGRRVAASESSVLSCRRVAYRGEVFNFEVERTNNYFANGFLVHNCVDDPHDAKGAESEAERTSVNEWWDLTMSTRGTSRNARRVIIMQRLNEDDLSGHVLEEGDWVHLCLPMRFEPGRMKVTPLGKTDPRTVEGELLTPRQFDEKKVSAMERSMGSYGTSGQFQQRPSPAGGDFFKLEWFQMVDVAPVKGHRVRYWDKAGSKGAGDYSAGVLMLMTNDRMFFVEDVVRGQWSARERNKIMEQTAKMDHDRYGGDVAIWIEQEPGSSGKESAEISVLDLVGFDVHAEPVSGQGDKQVRARPFAAQCEGGNVRLVRGAWNKAYLDELTVFPNGKNDDQVDASSGAFNKLILNQKKELMFW